VTAAALVLSLLASEAWLVGPAFLILYECATQSDWRRRLLGGAPFAAAGVAYAVAYAALGYGIRGSAMYLSPFHVPGEYLAAALVRVPLALAATFGGAPAILAGPVAGAEPVLVVWGLFTTLLLGGLLFALRGRLEPRQRQTLIWLGMGALLTPFLLISTAVTGRVLLVPMVAVAALAAQLLVLGWRTARGSDRARRWAALAVVAVGAVHLGLSPLTRIGVALAFGESSRVLRRLAHLTDLGRCREGGIVYLLTAADPGLSLFFGPSVAFYTPDQAQAERLRVLTIAPHDLRFARLEDRSFELEMLGLPRRTSDFERLYRPGYAPLEAGQAFVVEEMHATVVEAADGLANKIRFELATSLDAPSSCFVAWDGQRVLPVAVPAVGQSLVIPYQRGPAGP
jgi:hypothetical protein